MKQKSKWQIALIVIRNLARLFMAIVCYLAIEIRFRLKWIGQNLYAITEGYSSYKDMIQCELDNNRVMKIIKERQGI